MATYIPGITDYIPQFQPFTPDYNFLGNILQTKQSQYDANWQQLSKTYGTLLNSAMLREDNIQQRDEFFKMIDGDIKRISGLDLSLQQNVDAANKVFDSFYQNKEMVKDMVFTKEYQKQLEIGENFRNCIDQEKCGGKFWQEGINALNYRADEFKKASREQTLSMQPGRYVPMVNIQEKAMKFAKDLLGKDGAFGISSINWTPDGRYIVTTKNGAQLAVPLHNFLSAQFGKDQAVIDMFQTQSYVNRKNFIAQNIEQYGSEDAAEDAYFSQVDQFIQKAKEDKTDTEQKAGAAQAKVQILEKKIQINGTTGDDILAHDYEAALIDNAQMQVATKQAEEDENIANSIYDAGDNRQMKRSRVDALYASMLMKQEFISSAVNIANLTGETSVKEDPYAKSYYDFSLEMKKQQAQYDLMDRNERNKNMYELMKEEALMEAKLRGLHPDVNDEGTFIDDFLGTAAKDVDENKKMREYILENVLSEKNSANGFVNGYTNTLMTIIKDDAAEHNDKLIAMETIEGIFGRARKDPNTGKWKPGYDRKSNSFVVDENGNTSEDPTAGTEMFSSQWRKIYEKAKMQGTMQRSLPSHAEYLDNQGKKFIESYNTARELEMIAYKTFQENNKNIKTFKEGSFKDDKDKMAWNSFFTKDNKILTKEQYRKAYADAYLNSKYNDAGIHRESGEADEGGYHTGSTYTITTAEVKQRALEEADDKYDEMMEIYKKTYNEGESKGVDKNGQKVALVHPLHGSYMFGNMGGGSYSGAKQWTLKTDEVAGLPMRGLMTFDQDVARQGSNVIFTAGNVMDQYAASKNGADNREAAKLAYQQWMLDLKSGKLSDEEKAEAAKITYANTALGSQDYEAMIINYPISWLKQYQAKEGDPETWADNEKVIEGGTAVYIKKNGAQNQFHQNFEWKSGDVILNHTNKVIKRPDGSTVTLMKRNKEGEIVMQGNLAIYDNTGKRVGSQQVSEIFDQNTGGQNAINAVNMWLDIVNDANQQVISQQTNLTFDVNQLPAVRDLLNEQAGDQPRQLPPSQIYAQMVSEFANSNQ